MIERKILEKHYVQNGMSMLEISKILNCSVHKVAYWMDRHHIGRRSISDAIYQKHNPNGDPFKMKLIKTQKDAKLLGMGIGLYWGEGTKSNKYSVRLGNTDPALLNMFILFLTRLCGIDKNDLRFGLQIFSDINPKEALNYWAKELDVEPVHFYKTTVTISGSIGTYRKKSTYGVVTVYYHNKKLRDIIVGMLPK